VIAVLVMGFAACDKETEKETRNDKGSVGTSRDDY